MPPATRTMSAGAAPKLSFHVPAAAHTSSYCNKSGSTNTRSWVVWPNGGTAPIEHQEARSRSNYFVIDREFVAVNRGHHFNLVNTPTVGFLR